MNLAVQVCERVIRLFSGELFAVFADELLPDRVRGHSHQFLVLFRLFEGVTVPVCLDVVNRILARFSGELLAVLLGELIIKASFAHMHSVCVQVCLRERRSELGGNVCRCRRRCVGGCFCVVLRDDRLWGDGRR